MKKIFLFLIALYTFSFSDEYCTIQNEFSIPILTEYSSYEIMNDWYDTGVTIAYPDALVCQNPMNANTLLYRTYSTYNIYIITYSKRIQTGAFNGVYYPSQNLSKRLKFYVCTDSSKKYNLSNSTCETYIPPLPTCQFGYHNDTAQSGSPCVPDVQCPSTMKYFTNEVNWDFDIKTCVPNRDLTKPDCLNQGGVYFDFEEDINSDASKFALKFGRGCADASYIASKNWNNNLSFLVSGLLPSIQSSYLAQFSETLFAGGKTLKDFVNSWFRSSPEDVKIAGLLKYQPDFIDVKIQSDGTYAVMDYKQRTAIFDELNSGSADNAVSSPYGIETTSQVIPNNVYLGGDIHTFEANIIGTKSFLDDVKPFTVPDATPLNGVYTSTIDLKNSLFGTEKTSFPSNTVLVEKSTNSLNEVITKTATKINYPDGSYTNVNIVATKLADATKIYDITTTTPVTTNSGIRVFENSTRVTENASGQVTNVVPSQSVIKSVNENGYVTSSPNVTTTSSSQFPSTETGTINLSNIQSSLNKINQQLADIKTAVNTAPTNINEFNTAIGNFKSGMTNWSLGLDNAVSFINGMKDNFTNLETQLSDALATFEDKPELTLPSGSCPFQASWYGDTFTVDPCMFISPYRPILSAFLTFFMSWSVFWFCLKFFFKVG